MKASFISLAIAAASALVAATPDADFPPKAVGPPIVNDCKAICNAKCHRSNMQRWSSPINALRMQLGTHTILKSIYANAESTEW
ncbi:hypothetical protein CSUB01_09760 [Colletotrichum sublineola]|uniref:Uncharacterized protein n=1 Tax=Colletotrichum sublineola TaxID=1173701 RepID=A0A066X2L7_COLSU|nr:hypothetical protein CSUB01_09760 [Colletotrichum sublineola]